MVKVFCLVLSSMRRVLSMRGVVLGGCGSIVKRFMIGFGYISISIYHRQMVVLLV